MGGPGRLGCCVAIALVAAPGRCRAAAARWLALGGLALLAAWTLLSIDVGADRGQRLPRAARSCSSTRARCWRPALLLRRRARCARSSRRSPPGSLIVIGYGISERLLPGLLHFARSVSAEGRLEQPLTYWNAMGELAAIGFVLVRAARRRRAAPAGDAGRGGRGARRRWGWGCT